MNLRQRGRLRLAAIASLLLAATIAAPAATATDAGEPRIVYSETYRMYLRFFPGGYAPNGCELAVAVSGNGGVCTTEFAPVWFYPDGTTGDRAWIVDPLSPTGWSVEPDPCADAFVGTDPDTDWWPLYIAYLDWLMGWTSDRPEGITDLQGGCLIGIYGF
jgi:hypothetical protein